MMSEEITQNGRITENGEEEVQSTHSPRHSSVTTPTSATTPSRTEPEMEYFDRKGGGGSEGYSEEDSPRGHQDRDDVSHHSRSYVTVSPPVSVSPASILGRPDVESLNGTEDGQSFDYEPNEVVKPKPLPRKKLSQETSSSSGETSGGVVKGAGSKQALLDEGQGMDLKIEITERKFSGVKQDFISYRVCTQSSRPANQFEQSSYSVWRRYKDFEWLQEMLEKHHSTLIVPPLPGKQLARYFDQKSDEFLNERERALDKFLKRLSAHPYFSFDRHLKMFLTAELEEFSQYMTDTSSGTNKILGAVTSSVKMAANSLRLKNPDPEYAKEAKYFEDLGEKLRMAEKVATRLHTEREELASNQEELSATLAHWAMSEPQLVDPIRCMGTCVENCTTALSTLNEDNALSLMVTAKEYQLYCTSGMSAVRRRDGLQLERERAAEEREKRKKIHDDAANAGKLQKLPKLADDLQKVGVEAERTHDDLSVANERLRVDIEKWREAKNQEMNSMMSTFADNHINYHQKCFNEWEKVLSQLRSADNKPSTAQEALESSNASPFSTRAHDETTPTLKTWADNDSARADSPDLFT